MTEVTVSTRHSCCRRANALGAQRRERVGDPLDELAVVVERWVKLPGAVRRAIMGAVCAFE